MLGWLGSPRVGIDIVDVSRFAALPTDHPFFTKTFTQYERDYCQKYAEPGVHFAGIFAAKEAASKALGTAKFPVLLLEVRHAPSGAPEMWKEGKRVRVSISISHTASTAVAVAIA